MLLYSDALSKYSRLSYAFVKYFRLHLREFNWLLLIFVLFFLPNQIKNFFEAAKCVDSHQQQRNKPVGLIID